MLASFSPPFLSIPSRFQLFLRIHLHTYFIASESFATFCYNLFLLQLFFASKEGIEIGWSVWNAKRRKNVLISSIERTNKRTILTSSVSLNNKVIMKTFLAFFSCSISSQLIALAKMREKERARETK